MSIAHASEVTYELHSLGWKAFQNLCITILSDIWGQTIQSFFDSKDGGRDGAFSGRWASSPNVEFTGSFTVQCKFVVSPRRMLKLASLTDELKKAQRLAQRGLADNYLIFTNANLSGVNDEIIRSAFESIPGVKRCAIYGRERICQIIHETRRLRMLVPRIYGLGDLGQILDERAYGQAREILSSLGDDLDKFIITGAFRQAAKALVDHGFVLLLGEPMSGKSTIAAALAVGALDEWGCSTIKIRDADDFVTHYNPNEKQLFWVDDAFGPTQVDWDAVINWSKTFPHVKSAIKMGSKVIFTSRDYIYRSAKRQLKESALPLIRESQVVIYVEQLTRDEREQILYNHIKLGSQEKAYKRKIKPFLSDVAIHEKFSPEIARRLGDPTFTKELLLSKTSLSNFVENPLDLLCEIINTMEDSCRAAIALVFMRGGSLPSPPDITPMEENALSRIGGALGEAVRSLEVLNGSLLIRSINDGRYYWQFKHPTVRDAFAVIVASSSDLMDIYITGAPIGKLFSEVSCGDVGMDGVSVIVPRDQYHIIFNKIDELDKNKWFNSLSINRFLAYRCDKEFLRVYLERCETFIGRMLSSLSYISSNSDIDVLARLHEFGLLPDKERAKAVSSISELAIDIPDSGFLRDRIKRMFLDDELSDVMDRIREDLLPNLSGQIDAWRRNYNGERDPEVHFEELKMTIDEFKEEFSNDRDVVYQFDSALAHLDQIIDELKSNYSPNDEDGFQERGSNNSSITICTRSIFDDVDV